VASRKDKKRQELDRLLKAQESLGIPADLEPWEQAMWVILRRHGTKEGASKALKSLQRRFVDVNEVRAAKATEIADIIKRNVKNDAYRVARQVRGFLWRFHKDLHSIELSAVDEYTYAGLKKFLSEVEDHPRDIALALFCHYCEVERADAKEREAAEEAGEEKGKKRGEKEFGQAIERLRLLCAVAVHGTVPAKTKQGTAHRQLAKAWTFSSEPPLPRPKPPPPPKIVIEAPELITKGRRKGRKGAGKTAKKTTKKAAENATSKKTKKTASKSTKKTAKKASKKTTKKTAKKKTTKKSAGKRGGGTARPRTTRASRARTTKKSSRR
jgi:hypothetical protein